MFAMTLLPMGAFAASDNNVGGFIPTVTEIGTYDLASVSVDEDGIKNNLKDGVFTLQLPTGVKFTASSETAIEGAYTEGTLAVTEDLSATGTSQTLTVKLTGTDSTSAKTDFVLALEDIKVETVGTGDITLTIADVSTGITEGAYVVGRFTSGSASVKALSTTTTGESRPAKVGQIRITENTKGALDGETIEIKLPSGMYWRTGMTDVAGTIDTTNFLDISTYTADDDRKIEFTVNSGATSAEIFDITPLVYIDDSEAKHGDIVVTFSGSANLDSSELKIGAYSDFGITVTADEAEEILAGREDADAAVITVKETIKASILSGRDIKVKLPDGVYFNDVASTPKVKVTKGSDIFTTTKNFSINGDKDTATITADVLSGSATTFEIKDISLSVTGGFSGDVVATLEGAAGITGEVVIATVTKPVTVTAESGTVAIGKQSQEIGDITITENEAGALIDGKNLVLDLPAGSTWSSIPTIEVVGGDLELGTVTKASDKLYIPVDTESDVASTIKLSNVKISTDRTIAEGDMKITIDENSPAVVEYNSSTDSENTVVSVKVATVTTPAEDGVVQPVVMTVGSTIYAIDGVEMTMDVAPYIKDSRTYFPVRYVAQALGITADNVVWDGAQRTVTIFRGNRIVQVTIGSTTMLVNGVPLTMDVAPEITADRTMLPIRFVAQGLGVNVDWDAATQTVTLN